MSVGRGRGATLPAWATAGSTGGGPVAPVAVPSAPLAAAPLIPSMPNPAFTALPVMPGSVAPVRPSISGGLPWQQATPSAAPAHGWTEHKAPDGRTYYYHAAKGTSTYEKPDEMKTEAEKSMPWREHTAPNGKPYFYNVVTKESVWTEPKELTEFKAKQAAAKGITPAPAAPAATVQAPKPLPMPYVPGAGFTPVVDKPVSTTAAAPAPAPASAAAAASTGYANLTDEEKVQKFKEMLRDKNVRSDARWAEVVTLIQNDKRYALLKTQGERKQAFSEYTTAKAKEEREEQRKKSVSARDNFMSLLSTKAIPGSARYREVEASLGNDPAWKAIESSTQRMELFDEYVTETSKREKEKQRRELIEKEDAFIALLKSRPDIVNVSAKWADIKHLLADDPAYQNLDKNDRVRVYRDYILALEKEEEERRRQELEKERARLREVEKIIFDVLDGMVQQGRITARSKWDDFEKMLNDTSDAALQERMNVIKGTFEQLAWAAAAVDAIKNGGMPSANDAPLITPTPSGDAALRRLFDDAVVSADKLIRNDRRLLKDMVLDAKQEWHDLVAADTTFDAFITRLSSAQEAASAKHPDRYSGSAVTKQPAHKDEPMVAVLQKLRPWSLQLIYEELKDRAVEIAEELSKKQKKQRDRFEALLMDYFYRSDHVDLTWEEAKELIRHRSAYQETPSECRHEWFEAYMARLRAKAQAHKARLLAERAAQTVAAPQKAQASDDVEEGEEPEEPKATHAPSSSSAADGQSASPRDMGAGVKRGRSDSRHSQHNGSGSHERYTEAKRMRRDDSAGRSRSGSRGR